MSQIPTVIRREIVKEVVTKMLEMNREGEYVVRTLIVDDTRIEDTILELLKDFCELTGRCNPEEVYYGVPDSIVVISTSNCKEWSDERFDTITILAVVKRKSFKIDYVYGYGIEEICIENICWHHNEIPIEIRGHFDELYGDLRARCSI